MKDIKLNKTVICIVHRTSINTHIRLFEAIKVSCVHYINAPNYLHQRTGCLAGLAYELVNLHLDPVGRLPIFANASYIKASCVL